MENYKLGDKLITTIVEIKKTSRGNLYYLDTDSGVPITEKSIRMLDKLDQKQIQNLFEFKNIIKKKENAKKKIIEIVAKEFGYIYQPTIHDTCISFYDSSDEYAEDTLVIYFDKKDKTVMVSDDYNRVAISAELHDAINDYMKELGWLE